MVLFVKFQRGGIRMKKILLGKEFENISNEEIKTLVQKAKDCNCTTWADFAELPKKLGS